MRSALRCASAAALRRRPAAAAAARRHKCLTAVNPYNGEVAWEVGCLSAQDGVDAVGRSHQAFQTWRRLAPSARAGVLMECSRILKEEADSFASVMATEMGKPVAQGKGEVLKCCTVLEYYAERAEQLLEQQDVPDVKGGFYVKAPLGVVLLIMPWNFPFWQVFRQAAAALTAGNVILCKHAPNVPRCAQLLETVFTRALESQGHSADVYINLPMDVEDLDGVMAHPNVRAVSLTGSTAAGRAVGAAASKLLKPSVLELGGSDPAIVLEDADIALAAKQCAFGRMLNAGQTCIATKRMVVVEDVYKQFLEAFTEEMKSYTHGDPQDPATTLGPLASHRFQEEVHGKRMETEGHGAKVALAGGIPEHPGAFYLPTVLYDVPGASPGGHEEMFGPVASVMRVKDEKEAVEVANATPYGLGASVYSRDLDRASRIARDELDVGMCFVNDFVKSSPHLPFGGVKSSGYGRECGPHGIEAFCNIKTVVAA
eukprot:TRINITY_DN19489_c0_g1_i1.p1 TRINITY_DN19489_c0_g1~~TRINITY_DN19489_c0_g1_i1.p1  ORF type:complete len:485 (+),score=197.68 TRINITY_DN19489_c0_g1_i1:59-1513(+)